MTRLQLFTFIKFESRVNNSTNLDSWIYSIIDEILQDYCNRNQYFELLKLDTALTLVTGSGQIDLPTDFATLKGIRYGIGTTPVAYRELHPMTESIKRTSDQGNPFFYFISSGKKLNVTPFATLQSTDQMLLTYYIDPTSIFSSDAHVFPVPRLLSTVKKEAIMRVSQFHTDAEGAKMSSQDAGTSYIASLSGGGKG